MKIRIRFVFLGGILLIISFFLITSVFISEEKRIAKVIDGGEKAVEAKDLEGCMKRLSFNYSDQYGMSYLQVKRFLEKFFQEFEEIEIEKEVLKIEVKDEEAQASMNLRVIVTVQNQRGYLIGSSESPANIKIDLEKVRTKWLVKRVEWPKRLHYQ